jgi:hypothetical protein
MGQLHDPPVGATPAGPAMGTTHDPTVGATPAGPAMGQQHDPTAAALVTGHRAGLRAPAIDPGWCVLSTPTGAGGRLRS